ncbi:rhodopsin [Lactobacillus sp. ESL0731]|uniref:rhodopsin n=1 Tax=unclassified Lactobacillus TaxID=2620435 RepID=UPI0023F68386|nr:MULTISPECIES: rhodopsin [unclassified Lactobacillus]WEV50619.1 rhodopsin [Lactobacillus sp. ESL0700]WEV61749.1 rhodopsin [Lactobacillus sp. ESL0731]
MMSLFWNQLLYFWQIIRYRCLAWLMFISLAIVMISIQLVGNPRESAFTAFFQGVSFIQVFQHQVQLPVLWFAYFSIPLLILLNSLQELWQSRTLHLRGLQFAPRKFVQINFILLAIIALGYSGITVLVLSVCGQLFKLLTLRVGNYIGIQAVLLLFLINCLGSYFLLLLQAIISCFNSVIGIVIPLCLLIITAYTAWLNNPLNSLMLARVNTTNFFELILLILAASVIYLVSDRFTRLS